MKKKQETCRWIYDCESHCGQAHLRHHLLNTSVITKSQNGSKNLLCHLGCAQQLLPVQSVWDGCKRSVAQSPHEVSVFNVFRIVKLILRSLLNNSFFFVCLYERSIGYSDPCVENKKNPQGMKTFVICRTFPLSGKIFATICPKQILLGHSRLRKKKNSACKNCNFFFLSFSFCQQTTTLVANIKVQNIGTTRPSIHR